MIKTESRDIQGLLRIERGRTEKLCSRCRGFIRPKEEAYYVNRIDIRLVGCHCRPRRFHEQCMKYHTEIKFKKAMAKQGHPFAEFKDDEEVFAWIDALGFEKVDLTISK